MQELRFHQVWLVDLLAHHGQHELLVKGQVLVDTSSATGRPTTQIVLHMLHFWTERVVRLPLECLIYVDALRAVQRERLLLDWEDLVERAGDRLLLLLRQHRNQVVLGQLIPRHQLEELWRVRHEVEQSPPMGILNAILFEKHVFC